MKSGLTLFCWCVACVTAFGAGICAPKATVVLPDAPTAVERSAAEELADGLRRMTGEAPAVCAEAQAEAVSGLRFYVGATRCASSVRPDRTWKTDEIFLKSVPSGVVLDGDTARAPIYAVVEYLERFCGVRWWTSKAATYPKLSVLPADGIDVSYVPPFVYRETYYLDGYDWRFKVRNRGNFTSQTRYMLTDLPRIPKAWGGDHTLYYYRGRRSAYHSFNEILPWRTHFAAHPDWYSMLDGERRAYIEDKATGKRHSTQLCLANAEMKAAYIRETIRRLHESPDVDFVSVTQNDCHRRCACWCRCPECEKMMAEDGGSPAGPYLRFVNEVAEALEKEFPNLTVDTFAYQFTRKPPLRTRPRHNVTVRLCTYESDFSTPIAERRYGSNRAVAADLEAWSRIAPGQIIVWDYLSDYPSYVLPHPNLFSIGPNVRFFRDCGAVGVYSLGDALSSAGTFATLHHYVNAHLLWNPDLNARTLMDEFLSGYFGAASAPYLSAYIALLESAATAKGQFVGCTHPDDPFVTADEALALSRLMDAALAAAGGPEEAKRVRCEKLSIDHLFILHWDEYRAHASEKGEAWTRPATRREAVAAWEAGLAEQGAVAYRETVEASDLPSYLKKLKEESK